MAADAQEVTEGRSLIHSIYQKEDVALTGGAVLSEDVHHLISKVIKNGGESFNDLKIQAS